MIKVDDGQAADGQAHNFRIIMTPSDTQLLHRATNTTSNERLGATVDYNEQEVFYDVGVRLKGSFVGRNVSRVAFVTEIRFWRHRQRQARNSGHAVISLLPIDCESLKAQLANCFTGKLIIRTFGFLKP